MYQSSQITRRTMLAGLGAAGVAVMAAPYILPSSARGANNRLKIGLIGCGSRARGYPNQLHLAGERISAMCDVDSRQFGWLRQAAKGVKGGAGVDTAKVYHDYRKLLEDKSIDAVVIAVGQRWHTAMSKAALQAGKHVFCEKPLAHSVAEAREMRDLGRQTKLVTQVGSQGGSTNSFRRAMEVIQAGILGDVTEVHAWIKRGCPPSQSISTQADPIPAGLNWDFWCGPSRVLPFKKYYLGGGLTWGQWLEFGDGHLPDMGAHALNLPWRALKLGAPRKVSVQIPEPLKDSYPSATTFRWDFDAREKLPPVTMWWHDGYKAEPPAELGRRLLGTYRKVPEWGVLLVGTKGLICTDAWGRSGVMVMNGEKRGRSVLHHAAAKAVPVTLPRVPDQEHMSEFITAVKGGAPTFQPFSSGACVAEIAMTGILAMRLGKPIEWDSEALMVKGMPEADPIVHRAQRTQWL